MSSVRSRMRKEKDLLRTELEEQMRDYLEGPLHSSALEDEMESWYLEDIANGLFYDDHYDDYDNAMGETWEELYDKYYDDLYDADYGWDDYDYDDSLSQVMQPGDHVRDMVTGGTYVVTADGRFVNLLTGYYEQLTLIEVVWSNK